MQFSRLYKSIMVAAMLSPLFFLDGCTCSQQIDPKSLMTNGGARKQSVFNSDAPQSVHSVADLATDWVWTTTDGDAASDFQTRIERSADSEIVLINFHNLAGAEMRISIDGDNLSFQGPIMNGDLEVRNGKGILTNGWLTISLSYDIFDGSDTEHFEARLEKGHIL